MGIANSLAALDAGANRIDGSVAGVGAGSGNTPLEELVAVLDRDALTLGDASVYCSFLLFTQRAGKAYGVPARDIFVEPGNRSTIGGQEDMIEDLALTMAKEKI